MSTREAHAWHPDAELLVRTRAALDAWDAQRPEEWPTSQVLGGGAIAAVERLVSDAHDGRPCLLLPSATYALRLALATAGVEIGDTVLVVDDPWPAGLQAVRSLGASPLPVSADVDGWPSPGPAVVSAAIVTDRDDATAALTALHRALPDRPVIEDASRLHPTAPGSPVRDRSGDYVVYSLGPGKPTDSGEGGLLILPDRSARTRALTLSAHPTRLAYSHRLIGEPRAFPMRVHPIAAIMCWHQLTRM